MSLFIACDHVGCEATVPTTIVRFPGRVVSPKGWKAIGRHGHICPKCAKAFASKHEAGAEKP